jgi:TfoX/Sxy family transcriptional regulator of competence genes
MAYDEGLAQRVREQMARRAGVTEKKMFGGLAFLMHGNMSVGVLGDDLIVRLDPADYERALEKPGARVFDLTGRPMKGWLMVDAGAIDDDDALAGWVGSATRFVDALPAKAPGSAKPRGRQKEK